jgi:hypothetical protein
VPRTRPTSLPRTYLARKLVNPLPTTDGGVLRTIGDAIAYMTALPKHREMRKAWQHACKLILGRAPVEAITRQVSLALFLDAALDLGGKDPAGARPRAKV